MARITNDDVLKALDQIIDPASGRSVVHQGIIQGLAVREGHVSFAVEVDAERGSQAEPLRAACESAVRKLPNVLSVTAVLTAHEDRHAGHGRRGRPQPAAPAAPQGIPGVGSIIAVASGKGGVGKSTVAVNLAIGLSRLGLKSGLLDADIYGPSVPRLLEITEKPESDGKKLKPIEKFGIKCMSIGFLVKEDEAVIWRGPMVMSALTQMMMDVAWAPLDILVVDMPPGTGDAQLTMAQRVPLKGAVIVSTPQDLALIDARKAIAMFQRTQVPILGMVENMSSFTCPDCGHESHIFGHGGAKDMARRLEVPFLGDIPLAPALRELSDAGKPVVATRPESKDAKALVDIAARVAEQLKQTGRAAPRIVLE
ncbi:MAG: Mrp/NBP35 family ATP-binding protein [Alphaproteobacteria bacterium]|nr:Mrp/NBP35 family ATP-binding protein [Alphaproteobacteria bacterium]